MAVTRFDRLMDKAQQTRWLDGGGEASADSGARRQNPEHRMKYRPRYEALRRLPMAADVLRMLALYGRQALPLPAQTERRWWSVSCLPYFPRTRTLARVNVNWQEVLALYREGDEVRAKFFLRLSDFTRRATADLDDLDRAWLDRFATDAAAVEIIDHQYRAGGADQFGLAIIGTNPILKFLRTSRARRSLRAFNLALMRRGANPYANSHCYDLADHLIPGELGRMGAAP